MINLTRTILATLAVVLSAPLATAQYSNSGGAACPTGGCSLGYQPAASPAPRNDYSAATNYRGSNYRGSNDGYPGYDQRGYEDLPSRTQRFDYSGVQENVRGRVQHEMSRLRNGYDYRAPLDSAVEDNFRAPISYDYQNRSRDYGYPSSNHNADYLNRGSLPDPFRLPGQDNFRNEPQFRNAPLSQDYRPDNGYQSRRRIPLDRVDYSNYDSDYSPRRPDPRPLPPRTDYDYRSPQSNDQVRPGLDPFTPPLPRREGDNEADAIFKAISARYSNPVNVRAVQAMSTDQALALYREVSQQCDQRHLEPTSYDLRVRRGVRNLGLALENPAFTQALGMRSESFQLDGFRTQLSRISDSMRVASYSDAQQVVQGVMQEAQQVGLPANVVAFEFANATIDTLDRFSALEPSEPGRGASLDLELAEHVRSALLEGEIVGIGVEVKIHDNGLLIMKALRGGPAAEARLQSGDIITAINGRTISGMPMASSVDLMKGSEGSRIQLRIVRDGSAGGNVTLVRRRVRIYTVNDVRMQPGTDKVAYISLSQFGQKSTEELDQALQQMYNNGMKSLILDMRGNPGGLLNVCVDITNRFLPCGTIVSTKGRLSADNMIETATYNRTWSTPLVVLIDGDSASASEIFAAAVQDNRRGIVVGEQSYGKGTVQTHFPLSSISGNLRLTTARFYSPNGRAMSGQGVTPDVRIADADGPANGDRVLEEAVKIAQSQQLRDIAQAARQCRPKAAQQLQRNSFNSDIRDTVTPKTVLR